MAKLDSTRELDAALPKEAELVSVEQKAELEKYNASFVWKDGDYVFDLGLLDDSRSLIHAGKLLRSPDSGPDWDGWSELFVLLFDNYLVITKPEEKDGVTRYSVTRRPIPLELLTIANFTDPPVRIQPATGLVAGILRYLKGGGHGSSLDALLSSPSSLEASSTSTPDSRDVYPCTIQHAGQPDGDAPLLYAESAHARAEWHAKLTEARDLRLSVQEANKVFEIHTLSIDAFPAPALSSAAASKDDGLAEYEPVTNQVTCSVLFTTVDRHPLIAIGCANGVWAGSRHGAKPMQRVLDVKLVTQCAVLEGLDIFLVLADKSLLAYRIEALHRAPKGATQTPQMLSGTNEVQFFRVGTLGGRTFVIYVKKKGVHSVFRVLESVVSRVDGGSMQPASSESVQEEWFKVYKDFFLPYESYDIIFLKARLAILCSRGFEIMDLDAFQSVTIPQWDGAETRKLAERCDSRRPLGMFRTSENEFLLCYDEFGFFVNRHGDPVLDVPPVEWETSAARVAWHPPYILIFTADGNFIEIRTVEAGGSGERLRLCQIIRGEDVRATWDAGGLGSNGYCYPKEDQSWADVFTPEPRIHGVMRASTTTDELLASSTPTFVVHDQAQHVFELRPVHSLRRFGS